MEKFLLYPSLSISFIVVFFNTVLIFQNFASYWDTYIISHLFYLRYLIFDIKQNLNFWDNKGYNL